MKLLAAFKFAKKCLSLLIIFIALTLPSCNKMGSNGFRLNVAWSKTFGGTYQDYGDAIVCDASGNYLFAADVLGSTDGDLNGYIFSYSINTCMGKLSPDGEQLWLKPVQDLISVGKGALAPSPDGGMVAGGFFDTYNGNTAILKLDAAGHTQWQTTVDTGNCHVNGIVQTANGYMINSVRTVYASSSSYNPQITSAVKLLNAAGTLTASAARQNLANNTLIALSNNEYLVAGSSDSGTYNGSIAKVDASGNEIWRKNIGAAGSDVFNTALATSDGNILLGGTTTSVDMGPTGNHGGNDAWLVKVDRNGKVLWNKTFGGSGYDEVISVVQTNDGNFLVAANTDSKDGDVKVNAGETDIWLFKIDNTGNLIGQMSLGGSKTDKVSSMIRDKSGAYVLIGSTNSNDGQVSANHGNYDAWIVKLKEQ